MSNWIDDPYPTMKLNFCFDTITGNYGTNTTWEQCLGDPTGNNLEIDGGGVITLENNWFQD